MHNENKKNIDVFVLTHGTVSQLHPIFNNGIFKPVCCGAELSKNQIPGVIYDNVGENISKYNRFLNDPTGIFYIGKHLDEISPTAEYIGIMQYSKFFKININNLDEKTITAAFLLDEKTAFDSFNDCFFIYFKKILDEFLRRLKNGYPKYFCDSKTSIETFLKQKYKICFNMFIVHRNVFSKWFKVLENGYSIITQMIEDNYHSDFSDLMKLFEERLISPTPEQIFGQMRVYATILEMFDGYSFFYITNGWSNEYRYIAAKYFGLDQIRNEIRTKDINDQNYYKYPTKNKDKIYKNLLTQQISYKSALVAIAKDEDNYLKEWVEYHLNIGFDDIYIYQNDWKYTRGDINDDRVHFLEINGAGKQVECYNGFIENYSSNYGFAAFFDIDEFLYIKKDLDLKTLLNGFSDKPAVFINWRVFGDSGLSGISEGNYSVLKRFVRCSNKLDPLGKNIINLNIKEVRENVRFHNPHILLYKGSELRVCDPSSERYTACGCIHDNLSDEPCELYHYRNKTWGEYVERRYMKQDVMYPGNTKAHYDMESMKSYFRDYNRNEIYNNNLTEAIYSL